MEKVLPSPYPTTWDGKYRCTVCDQSRDIVNEPYTEYADVPIFRIDGKRGKVPVEGWSMRIIMCPHCQSHYGEPIEVNNRPYEADEATFTKSDGFIVMKGSGPKDD